MKANRIHACLAACVLMFSATACGPAGQEILTPETDPGATSPEAGVTEAAPVAEYSYDAAASITFADGKYAFLGSDSSVNPSAKETLLELVERDGHNAVKVTSSDAGKLYVGIQMDALLGDDVSKAASVEIGLETEIPGGFASTAGNISSFIGGNQKDEAWSIYLENKNPKTISAGIPAGAAAGDYIVLSLDDSVAGFDGIAMYIHTISFKDADGNVLNADTSAEYVTAAAPGSDRSNLFGLIRATEVGQAASSGAWAQATIITDVQDPAIAELLVPGSVVEITYKSETGNLWIVMPDASSWLRVGVGDNSDVGEQYSYMNASHNIAQITYEQIAEVCGDDFSGWGARMQAESDGAWEVFSVKIGMAAPNYGMTNFVVVGQGASAGAWAQADIIPDIQDPAVAEALVPGSVIELTYTSETGEIWIVLPDDGKWTRVGVGDYDNSGQGYAICDGNRCYIPFETIAEIEGTDDITQWGGRIQAEASTAWEVYSVRIGTAAEFLLTNSQVEVTTPGAASADAWAQADIIADISSEEIAAALVPGSVLNITYKSDGDVLWIVLPDDGSWTRVGVGMWDESGNGDAICNGYFCQIPFETIAAIEGTDDVSAWGARIQAESNASWEVYSVTIGTVK